MPVDPSMAPPLRMREGGVELFVFEDGEAYDVTAAKKAILAAPSNFEFGEVILDDFQAQIDVVEVNENHITRMADIDAARPIIIGNTPTGLRLIDGYHRAHAVRRRGGTWVWGFALSVEQTARFRVPPP